MGCATVQKPGVKPKVKITVSPRVPQSKNPKVINPKRK